MAGLKPATKYRVHTVVQCSKSGRALLGGTRGPSTSFTTHLDPAVAIGYSFGMQVGVWGFHFYQVYKLFGGGIALPS